eukprot:TRINITY_DN8693_c0_g1_i1.p1 TRINITY_DN8693_c0_g1~~TRINITY_DN8693_c0_g1_i1.p1  ORF type:complete len:746 (+),score=179.00 TRINITY_DN8693_c0_g1_i1:39-2276(+)
MCIRDSNGIRYSWNVWPTSRLESTRMVVPVGAMYTPLKKIPNMRVLNYEPVRCRTCPAILNPYCTVDVRGKLWICPFCFQRNQFPPQYMDISETHFPPELVPTSTTIEYNLRLNSAPIPPIFIFVVDTCLEEKHLQALKDSLLMSLSLIPENSLVGLVTYGSMVQIYELAFSECPKSYVFRGSKDLSPEAVKQYLGGNAPTSLHGAHNRFLRPYSEVSFTLETILEELQRDSLPIKSDQRPQRATSTALSVTLGLLEASFPNTGARVMLFSGGPPTVGSGMIASEDLKENVRGHREIIKDKAKYVQKAAKFYNELAARAVQSGHVVDFYGFSFDAVGLYEMRELVKQTGGIVVFGDEFDSPLFKESFRRSFKRPTTADDEPLDMGLNATLSVISSREIKVAGAIGHLASLQKKTAYVAETEIGVGGTSVWKMCGTDPGSTVAIYFEIVNQHSNPIPQGQRGLIQYVTLYQKSNGQRIARVTTTSHPWADLNSAKLSLMNGFDQEAAAVLMARIAVFKAESEESFDTLRWLDRMLIRLVSKFAEFRKDDPSSFRLAPTFSLYPQFMFHLRRSSFLSVFNTSPDESTFYRLMLNRENVGNSLTMIQPTLDKYSLDRAPEPVLLSATSVAQNVVLLLDTFFTVVVWHGEHIAAWVSEGYHKQPDYENLRVLLDTPKKDSQNLMRDRFPCPTYVECVQGDSQSRYLTAVLDPAITHTNTSATGGGQAVFTDDVNLQVFMDHLKKLAVQQ